jgi:hypothetical protein
MFMFFGRFRLVLHLAFFFGEHATAYNTRPSRRSSIPIMATAAPQISVHGQRHLHSPPATNATASPPNDVCRLLSPTKPKKSMLAFGRIK